MGPVLRILLIILLAAVIDFAILFGVYFAFGVIINPVLSFIIGIGCGMLSAYIVGVE